MEGSKPEHVCTCDECAEYGFVQDAVFGQIPGRVWSERGYVKHKGGKEALHAEVRMGCVVWQLSL